MNAAQPLKNEGAGARDAGTVCRIKRFATLQAHLALAGFALTRAAIGYSVIARRDQTDHLDTLERIEQFHRSVAI